MKYVFCTRSRGMHLHGLNANTHMGRFCLTNGTDLLNKQKCRTNKILIYKFMNLYFIKFKFTKSNFTKIVKNCNCKILVDKIRI